MKDDFIPRALAELDTWEANFKEKLIPITQELQIDQEEATTVIALLEAHRNSYTGMMGKRAEAQSATQTHGKAHTTAIAAYWALIRRIKSDRNYTEAIGHSLGIIGTDRVFETATAKPLLTVSKAGNKVVIKFTKEKAHGVHIHCRRGDEPGFSFLVADTASPYHDSRPNLIAGQSEQREYKAWYFIDDATIGQESDVVNIVI